MISKENFKHRKTLHEFLDDDDDDDGDSHIFFDVKTGKHYVVDDASGKLVELNTTNINDLKDSFTPEELEEIAKLIDKEFEEREQSDIEVDAVDPDEIFSDEETFNDAETETAVAKAKEKRSKKELEQRKQARQERRERSRGGISLQTINNLKLDIEELIAQQVRDKFGTSWTKVNKTYNTNTGPIIAPGRVKLQNKKIPVLAVYFDQSASWRQSDVDKGFDVLSVLDEYMDEGKLIVDVKYFSNNLHVDATSARNEGGTSAGPLVIADINENEPDNVLIMTDSDFDWYAENWADPGYQNKATVEGGVWMMFKDGKVSKWLTSHLHGDEETKYYKFN